MSSEGAETVLIAAIISVVIRGDDGAPIAGLGVRGTSMILWGKKIGFYRMLLTLVDSF